MKATSAPKFKYEFKNPRIAYFYYSNIFKGKGNYGWMGRLPQGLEYQNSVPVVIFGCSFAQGTHLDNEQTLSYKLSHVLKRPVYNRAVGGAGPQFMYY